MSNTEDLIESVRGDEAAMKRELQAAWSRLQEADAEESFDDAAFIRICADELGDPYAQLLASHMALEGIGMDPDSGAARAWLEKACAADFPLALVQLGRFLTIEGKGRKDEAKAPAMLQKGSGDRRSGSQGCPRGSSCPGRTRLQAR